MSPCGDASIPASVFERGLVPRPCTSPGKPSAPVSTLSPRRSTRPRLPTSTSRRTSVRGARCSCFQRQESSVSVASAAAAIFFFSVSRQNSLWGLLRVVGRLVSRRPSGEAHRRLGVCPPPTRTESNSFKAWHSGPLGWMHTRISHDHGRNHDHTQAAKRCTILSGGFEPSGRLHSTQPMSGQDLIMHLVNLCRIFFCHLGGLRCGHAQPFLGVCRSRSFLQGDSGSDQSGSIFRDSRGVETPARCLLASGVLMVATGVVGTEQ